MEKIPTFEDAKKYWTLCVIEADAKDRLNLP